MLDFWAAVGCPGSMQGAGSSCNRFPRVLVAHPTLPPLQTTLLTEPYCLGGSFADAPQPGPSPQRWQLLRRGWILSSWKELVICFASGLSPKVVFYENKSVYPIWVSLQPGCRTAGTLPCAALPATPATAEGGFRGNSGEPALPPDTLLP